jgi:PRTRC genetic system protein E
MHKKEEFMFTELMPVIQDRPLTITVAVLTNGKIKVCVVPQSQEKDRKANKKLAGQSQAGIARIPEPAIQALTAPLALTGTPEELDANLAKTLTTYADTHATLQHGIEEAAQQITEALKALEERKKSKTKGESPKKDEAKGDNEKNTGHVKKDTATSATNSSPKPSSGGTLPLAWCAQTPETAVSAK